MTLLSSFSIPSPLGPIAIRASDTGVRAVLFDATDDPVQTGGPADEVCAEAARQLSAYFAGDLQTFDLPLDPVGTPFQQEVWRALGAIPFGKTSSYGALAQALGRPGAARAVGLANGQNPVGVVVPCHRVIGASGALVGYAGGLQRKRWLLQHEGSLRQGALF